jgi:hypothetical protein
MLRNKKEHNNRSSSKKNIFACNTKIKNSFTYFRVIESI